MVQAVLTIAGGAMGGNMGAMIGSVIGGLVDPGKLPDEVGNRLTDLQVTASTYGEMISILFGSANIAGNIIFSTPKIEVEETSTTGGKGGSPKQKKTNYTYLQSVMIALCEGPIIGITEINANGQLIWTNDTSSSTNSLIASSEIAKNIRVYLGNEDQEPDPYIQGYAGIENTSAYRGTACVFLEDFDITKYGRLPNITCKVVANGTKTTRLEEIYDENIHQMRISFSSSTTHYGYIAKRDSDNKNVVDIYRLMPGGIKEKLIRAKGRSDVPYSAYELSYVSKSDDNSVLYFESIGASNFISLLYPSGMMTSIENFFYRGIENSSNNIYCKRFGHVFIFNKTSANFGDLHHINMSQPSPPHDKLTSLTSIIDIDCTTDFVYCLHVEFIGSVIYYIVKQYGHDLTYSKDIYVSNLETNGLRTVSSNEIYVNVLSASANAGIWEISTTTPSKILNFGSKDIQNLEFDGKNFYSSHLGVFGIITETIESEDVSVGSILTKLCEKVDIKPEQLDVSSLTKKEVHGYHIKNRDTIANSIQTLSMSYFFDGIESDGLLKFVKRGGPVAANIPTKHLSARAFESDITDAIVKTRNQEMEMASEVTINYSDIAGDYLIGTQYARRQNTKSVNAITVPLALCLLPEEAKHIADVMLDNYWKSRKDVSFTLPYYYSFLQPTDIVTVTYAGITDKVRITSIDDQNGILSITGVNEDSSVYVQESVAPRMPAPSREIEIVSPSKLVLLDIPLLRDQDDKLGFYFAVSGYNDSWSGCSIYRSSDGGTIFNPIGKNGNKKALIGEAITKLGAFYSGNIFDEINSVVVETNGVGSLVSVTELAVLNGANSCVIGNEILQFKNATLMSANKYRLSGLLRGRKGTDIHINSHSSIERFVLLNAETIDIIQSNSYDYDLETFYKAVSFNEYVSSAISQFFVNTGAAQECYSPVHLGGGKYGSGFILKWIRRSRISNEWKNKVDVPIGEDSEAYEIEILDLSNNVKRVLTSNTNTVNYTNAMQTEDFGSVQSNCKFRVYQMSTLRGRGFPAETII